MNGMCWCEVTSSRANEDLNELLTEALAAAFESNLVLDAVVAQNDREREALWKIRETIPEAQRIDGASLKHDISLPITSLREICRDRGRLDSRERPGRAVGCVRTRWRRESAFQSEPGARLISAKRSWHARRPSSVSFTTWSATSVAASAPNTESAS